jgi:hypothetical protein
MKLAIVFNTCGLSGRENVDGYIDSINNILDQDFDDYRVILSSCLNSPTVRNRLVAEFEDRISYNFINELLPVNVTFNHSALKAYEEFGKFDGYMFIDSGVNFKDNKNVLKDLWELHTSGEYGMTAARADTDMGTFLWFKEGNGHGDESGQESLFKEGHLIFPIGKTTNLHCQIFSKEVFHGMGKRLMPDIFASHCTESTFSFVTASVGQQFVMHKDVIVSHLVGMDGPSAGFRPEQARVKPWKHLFRSPRTMEEIIADPEALECGMGYEECQGILMHDETKYNDRGYAHNPSRLNDFIKNNIYLTKESLDYDNINSKFIK